MDETPIQKWVKDMKWVGWTLTKEEEFINLNLGTIKQPQCTKINA
jgi:hypothetical protein